MGFVTKGRVTKGRDFYERQVHMKFREAFINVRNAAEEISNWRSLEGEFPKMRRAAKQYAKKMAMDFKRESNRIIKIMESEDW